MRDSEQHLLDVCMTAAFGETRDWKAMSESDQKSQSNAPAPKSPRKKLTPAAQRALDEAAARRASAAQEAERPKEFQGREGPDPARYGDWENKGIASDF